MDAVLQRRLHLNTSWRWHGNYPPAPPFLRPRGKCKAIPRDTCSRFPSAGAPAPEPGRQPQTQALWPTSAGDMRYLLPKHTQPTLPLPQPTYRKEGSTELSSHPGVVSQTGESGAPATPLPVFNLGAEPQRPGSRRPAAGRASPPGDWGKPGPRRGQRPWTSWATGRVTNSAGMYSLPSPGSLFLLNHKVFYMTQYSECFLFIFYY